MSLNKKMGLVAGTASAALTGLAFAGGPATPTSTDARITALEQQISQLKTENGSNWLNDQRAEEIRALVNEVMGDSSRRTSLLAGAGHAGWDNGFYLSSDDGAFTLRLKGLAQFRGVWNNTDNRGNKNLDESVFGFENSRTRLDFSGNLGGQDFTYEIQGNFDANGGAFTLLDAWARYQIDDNYGIAFGQLKAPFLREELIWEGNDQAVDRSYVHSQTNAGYVQGVQLDYSNNDNFRAWAAFTDGTNSLNTPALASGGTEYAFTARGEYLVTGEQGFSQFDDYASWSDDKYATMVGAAVHYQKGEFGTNAVEASALAWTVDVSTEMGGANVFASVVGRQLDSNVLGTSASNQLGFVVQGGYFLKPDEVELFGRWEYMDFDAVPTGFDDSVSLYTVGVNWYFNGQNRKWTNDIVYTPDNLPYSANNIGLNGGSPTEAQVVLRSQFQFEF